MIQSPEQSTGSVSAERLRGTGAVMRAGRRSDLDSLYRLATLGGTGLTNLPPDREVLRNKLAANEAALGDAAARERGAAILLIAEDAEGAIVGTSCVFPRVGIDWPFYSYRITRQARDSRAAGKRSGQKLLVIANDFDGEAEVGGLFIDPAARHLALGKLAARSRYLFIAQHREWFGRVVIAELRGWQDASGRSPVWEAIGRHFYDMSLAEADRFGAIHGNQFIADLGPRHPLYVSMLPPDAQAALGRPHDDGQPAHGMLMKEGFRDQGYVDIFDGGPTPVAMIDELSAVRDCRVASIASACHGELVDALVAAGDGAAFRSARVSLQTSAGAVSLNPLDARRLKLEPGETIRWCPM
jgi:arginine N-succinyltransferase